MLVCNVSVRILRRRREAARAAREEDDDDDDVELFPFRSRRTINTRAEFPALNQLDVLKYYTSICKYIGTYIFKSRHRVYLYLKVPKFYFEIEK